MRSSNSTSSQQFSESGPAVSKMPPAVAARAPKSPAPVETAAEYYTMKVGDNPWSIAMKHPSQSRRASQDEWVER